MFAAVQAIYEDVEATGHGEAFDWFLLSDTTDPDVWIAEERALIALRRGWRPQARVYYRHRDRTLPQGRQCRRFRLAAGAAPTTTWWCSTPTA